MFWRRLSFYLSGLAILTFGASLTIKARLGAGPWDSLNVGLAGSLGLTVGGWSIIIGIVLIVLNSLIAWKAPDLGGAITVTISGLFIDGWLIFALTDFHPISLFTRITCLSAGIVLIAFGIATYLQSKWSPSPIDDLMVSFRSRFHVSLGVAKTIGEALALVLAILFQGPVGIGTVFIAIGIGPFISLFYKLWKA